MRLREIDALRAGLVYGVVVFHSARVFDPFDFTVKADTESVLAGAFVLFASLWDLPLFFVLAGYGIWHSLGRRTAGAFARERLARLAVPLVFGLLVIVPPQVHVERLVAGEHPSSRARGPGSGTSRRARRSRGRWAVRCSIPRTCGSSRTCWSSRSSSCPCSGGCAAAAGARSLGGSRAAQPSPS